MITRKHFFSFVAAGLTASLATVELASADVLYDADFSNDSADIFHDSNNPPPSGPYSVSGVNYTLSYDETPATDSSSNYFFTDAANGYVRSGDFGGEHQFLSDHINVTNSTDLEVVYNGQQDGGSDAFADPGEFFEFFYVLDGAEVSLGTYSGAGDFDFTRTFQLPSGGDDLQVGFRADLNGAGDGFRFFDITVNGTVPEPATLGLLSTGLLLVLGRRRA